MIKKKYLVNCLGCKSDSVEVNELRKILNGSLCEDSNALSNEQYFRSLNDGISLLYEGKLLTAIHFYLIDNGEGYTPYSGWCGDHLADAKVAKDKVISALGSPSKQGGGEKGFMGKVAPDWVRYDFSDYVIHYSFSDCGRMVELITLMSPTSAP